MSVLPCSRSIRWARASVSSYTSPSSKTWAPYARHTRTIVSETPRGMITVAGALSADAANATPCAWLPAEAAATPRRVVQRGDLVESATDFESARRLEGLDLEVDFGVEVG